MYDHVVFISLDTLRSDCISYNPYKLWPSKYGLDREISTPVLDRIAAEGAFFSNCISAAPYTSASHATFFTGKWPLRHGVYEFFNRALATDTVFSAAHRAGFRTVFKVDFPIILGKFLGFDRGIDTYIVEDDDRFLDAIGKTPRGVSFAHFGGIHVPYGFHNLRYGGEAYRETVRRLEAEIPPVSPRPTDCLVETYRDKADLEMMIRYKRIVQHHYSEGSYSRLFQLYLDGVEHFLRTRFTPFFEKLTERLRGTRHLIVLFGDHGEEYDAESYGHHNSVNEGVIRVPVIFWGTGVKAGMHLRRIRSVDVLPTVLEMMDARLPKLRCDGRSLAGTVTEGTPYSVNAAFSQSYAAETTKYVAYQKRLLAKGAKSGSLSHVLYKEAVYMDDWKLIRQHYEFTQGGGIWGLTRCEPRFSLERIDDENCLQPCAAPTEAAAMCAALDRYNARRKPEARTVAVPERIRMQLQSMGYQV